MRTATRTGRFRGRLKPVPFCVLKMIGPHHEWSASTGEEWVGASSLLDRFAVIAGQMRQRLPGPRRSQNQIVPGKGGGICSTPIKRRARFAADVVLPDLLARWSRRERVNT